ncbi:MAG TPA: EscU/YscU/HrcU family type III secretion system export apparatus switch protein [Solirubrobacterales bacterium]|nr:EscU/YscU/HrcU family type III secretion system export apparatus switch protein [Solirubrobacterales bacterium]
MAGSDRTEKATPKRRAEARRKGQVARSSDLCGAVVLLAALAALAGFGPGIVDGLAGSMRAMLADAAHPADVSADGLGQLLVPAGLAILAAVAPVALACALAGLGANVAQVGFRISPEGLRPDPKRLNPVQGAKNIFGTNALAETAKSSAKVAIVGAIAALALLPNLTGLAAMVGIEPPALGGEIARRAAQIAWMAAAAYLAIAFADVFWQRHRLEKQLRMGKEEVKREQKEETISPELRSALRRRQAQMSRGRMMAAVLGADVVVANPTHFAVALRYDGRRPAPVVVAKGQDLIALEIRRVAAEHGVPVVENPPLARSLFDSVALDAEIPEHLYRAIAELLAFVYRTARRGGPIARAA